MYAHTATHRPAVTQPDTRRDKNETAPTAAFPQPGGRFRWWWQVLGSNQRRLSRRFYSPIPLFESYAAELRLCDPRRNLGRPPSAMRPWAPGFGVRAVRRPWRNRPRTGTDQPTDGHGPTHGRGPKKPRTRPAGAVIPTVRLASCL